MEHGAKRIAHGAKRMEHGAKGMEHGAKGIAHGAKRKEQRSAKINNDAMRHVLCARNKG